MQLYLNMLKIMSYTLMAFFVNVTVSVSTEFTYFCTKVSSLTWAFVENSAALQIKALVQLYFLKLLRDSEVHKSQVRHHSEKPQSLFSVMWLCFDLNCLCNHLA